MVYVSVAMVKVLDEKLDRGSFSFREFVERFGGPDEALQALMDLYSQGLLEHRGNGVFEVTDHGRRVVEAWRTSGRPEAEPWLDSRVYTMLYSSVLAGGRLPEKWRSFLDERGFVDEEGYLSPEGYSVYEALAEAPKRPVVTKAIAGALLALPEGPAEKRFYSSRFMDTLEAMGLFVRSIPNGLYGALTRPGRLLRKALGLVNIDAGTPALLNPGIYKALEDILAGREVDREIRELLGSIGYITAAGSLTLAGRLVLRAWRLLQSPIATTPTAISSDELKVMEIIQLLWEKAQSNPELAPSHKLVKEWAEKLRVRFTYYSAGLAIYHLESMGLLVEEYDEKLKRTVLRLTRLGEELLKRSQGRATTALGSRTLVEADQGLGFNEEWAPIAQEEGLLGTGGPTKYGLALQRASREASRSLLVTRLEAMLLKRLPEKRSMSIAALKKSFPGEEEAIGYALGKLEARGLVETLPDGRVLVTRPGLLVKAAVLAAPSGVATPVNPRIIKLLKAVKKLRTTEDVAKLVKETRLGLDELKDALVLARACKYLGRNTLTGEGEALLEALRLLEEQTEAEKPVQ